jgi:hypothetical protein
MLLTNTKVLQKIQKLLFGAPYTMFKQKGKCGRSDCIRNVYYFTNQYDMLLITHMKMKVQADFSSSHLFR